MRAVKLEVVLSLSSETLLLIFGGALAFYSIVSVIHVLVVACRRRFERGRLDRWNDRRFGYPSTHNSAQTLTHFD